VIEEPPLLTLRRNFSRPTAAQVKALAGMPTGWLVDALGGRGALAPAIKAVIPEQASFCGVAVTCRAGPNDNMAVFGALEIAQKGDVVVAAADAYSHSAVVGDLLLGMLKNRGVVAFVTDGCVRDIPGIRLVGLPCFASGVTPNSPAKTGPGTAGLPIVVGGAAVSAGDVVLGDADGVVVVPHAVIDTVIAKLEDVKKAEAALEAKVKGGLERPDWLREMVEHGRVKEIG
jgi:4-hydroxy-4-methyl-2-oxoglutarate aldolase